jgi:hypothetical protein
MLPIRLFWEQVMPEFRTLPRVVVLLIACALANVALSAEPLFEKTLDVNPKPIGTDKSVRYDYDIVYVRARRAGDDLHKRFYTDFSTPVTMGAGADLMLLHPDGSEELLVEGGDGSVTDPTISFDGEWVYFTRIHYLKKYSQWNPPRQGADIYKIHVKTRKLVQLTNQKFSPNTGVTDWSSDFRKSEQGKTHIDYGVFNMGPCPLPGGRIVFSSNRDGYRPSRGYPAIALQLFVMDDRDESLSADATPTNLQKIGHLNISGALHPVVMADGRIMFSSLESQGIRGRIMWGIWTIHPDGTNWAPLISAFDPGGAPNGFHFQTQLSDRSLVIEEYYNQNNSGFGAYIKLPPKPPAGYSQFGPAYRNDPRNPPWRFGRHYNGKGRYYRKAFMPTGSVSLTPFALNGEGPANPSNLKDKDSPKVGKVTHPSGAPDNHLLTIWSPGPTNHQYKYLPQLDGGIYLLKDGKVIEEPGQLLLIKNDPAYNESWPRALVSYKRIYGIDEPAQLDTLANNGKLSKHLPQGTPFGLIGTSSMYKRESYPDGVVPEGQVTSTYAGGKNPWKGLDAFTSHGNGMPINWHNQGGDAGLYTNDQVHAVRILAMEPTTDRHRGANSGRRFYNHATERLRILGEIPVRKIVDGKQPNDPDGNPDTSFLAKIPADTAFTFQTLDKDGMVLNMSQTWHQLRPGEVRHDCGGCHAHSQQPTEFKLTVASQPDYKVWDLVNTTPLLTSKKQDTSGKQWDAKNEAGLKTVQRGVTNVEYHRDVLPILKRSCVACHSSKNGAMPAAKLDLDADALTENVPNNGKFPGTYFRLALDNRAKYSHKMVGYDSWGYPQASRYIRMFQSRRSVLVWKLYGKRLDGFSNDDHPSESKPGAGDLLHHGEPIDIQRNRAKLDIDYVGSIMPPRKAVAAGKVKPLSDEDRRTLVRWIDLGCPIDLDYDPEQPKRRGRGWLVDDNRPILTINSPQVGNNRSLDRIIIGMHDYFTGLKDDSFTVELDFPVGDIPAGENVASKFRETSQGVWEWKLPTPVATSKQARIVVSVKDGEGNISRRERTFSIGPAAE